MSLKEMGCSVVQPLSGATWDNPPFCQRDLMWHQTGFLAWAGSGTASSLRTKKQALAGIHQGTRVPKERRGS